MSIFKKKLKGKLSQAEALGLITHEEVLRLSLERATKEMNDYEQKNRGKKTKKRK